MYELSATYNFRNDLKVSDIEQLAEHGLTITKVHKIAGIDLVRVSVATNKETVSQCYNVLACAPVPEGTETYTYLIVGVDSPGTTPVD
jgi:hypothetical protein